MTKIPIEIDSNSHLGNDAAELGKLTSILPLLKYSQNLFTSVLSKVLSNGVLPPKVINLLKI